jgi:hypothetical protein
MSIPDASSNLIFARDSESERKRKSFALQANQEHGTNVSPNVRRQTPWPSFSSDDRPQLQAAKGGIEQMHFSLPSSGRTRSLSY